MQVQLRFEMDEINEEEYNQQEAELLARLDAIRKAKRRGGVGMANMEEARIAVSEF